MSGIHLPFSRILQRSKVTSLTPASMIHSLSPRRLYSTAAAILGNFPMVYYHLQRAGISATARLQFHQKPLLALFTASNLSFSPSPLPPWGFNCYQDCTFTSDLSWPFTGLSFLPSKPIPARRLLEMTKFSCQLELLLGHLWNTASVCWTWGKTSSIFNFSEDGILISPNFSTSLTNIKYSRKTRFHFNGSDNLLTTDNFFSPS